MISPDHKSILKILLLILYSTLGSFYLGYMLGVYNLVQGTIEILYDWSTEESYFYSGLINGTIYYIFINIYYKIIALVPFGAIFGSLISGTMSTKIGKRWTFIIADVFGIFGCIILIFKGINIFIGRFVCGIAAGINAAVVPVFIYEMSPKNVSGIFGCIMQVKT